MKNFLVISSLICSMILAIPIMAATTEPTVVNRIDLARYSGKWFEIAHLPNFFQKQCVRGTTAEYTPLKSGMIEVCNTCIQKDGKESRIIGVARVDDPVRNSKLGVSFFEVLGIRPVWGDYWILGIGDRYQYSVVGDRSRKYAWILGREKQLSQKDLDAALAILSTNGFDISKLEYTVQ
jgi:apolipoprotein D and lipocalin family protein